MRSYSAWKRRVLLCLAHVQSRRCSSRALSLGVLALTGMPSRLPASPVRPKQGSFPPAGYRRLHRYNGPLGLPLDSVRFRLSPYAPGLCPTWAAKTGLSCSTPLFRSVLPPIPRGVPAPSPACCGCCAWPSPRHDGLGTPDRLSVENVTRLARRSTGCGPLLRSLLE